MILYVYNVVREVRKYDTSGSSTTSVLYMYSMIPPYVLPEVRKYFRTFEGTVHVRVGG
jgi:hypothetical protein